MTRSKQIELCFENSIQYIGQMCFYASDFLFIFFNKKNILKSIHVWFGSILLAKTNVVLLCHFNIIL
jgi:hypothetical protein